MRLRRRNPVYYTGRKDDLGLRTHPWTFFDGEVGEAPIWLTPDRKFAESNTYGHGFVYTVEFEPRKLFPDGPLIEWEPREPKPNQSRYLVETELGKQVLRALERDEIFSGLDAEAAWQALRSIDRGDYDTMETKALTDWIKARGYDSMVVTGDGPVNIAVFDPSAIKVVSVEHWPPGDKSECEGCMRRNPSDDELRSLERAAAAGDKDAEARLARLRTRLGLAPERRATLVELMRIVGQQEGTAMLADPYRFPLPAIVSGIRSVLRAASTPVASVIGRKISRAVIAPEVGAENYERSPGPGYVLLTDLPEQVGAAKKVFGQDWPSYMASRTEVLRSPIYPWFESGHGTPTLPESLWPAFMAGVERGLRGKRRNSDVDTRALERAWQAEPTRENLARWRAALNREGRTPPGEAFYQSFVRRAAQDLRAANSALVAAAEDVRRYDFNSRDWIEKRCLEFAKAARSAAARLARERLAVTSTHEPTIIDWRDSSPNWHDLMSYARKRLDNAASLLRQLAFAMERDAGHGDPKKVFSAVVWIQDLSSAVGSARDANSGLSQRAWDERKGAPLPKLTNPWPARPDYSPEERLLKAAFLATPLLRQFNDMPDRLRVEVLEPGYMGLRLDNFRGLDTSDLHARAFDEFSDLGRFVVSGGHIMGAGPDGVYVTFRYRPKTTMNPDVDPVVNVALMVDKSNVEGPGTRFALWTQGCRIRCPGCCNPDLFSDRPNKLMTVSQILAKVEAAKRRYPEIEGVTIMGGEPFEQDVALAELARQLQERGLSVMVFTGHRLEELKDRGSPLLPFVDLLVDGPYVKALHTTKIKWIGSSNQRLLFMTDFYDPSDPKFLGENAVEVIVRENDDGVVEVLVSGFPFEGVSQMFSRGRPPQ